MESQKHATRFDVRYDTYSALWRHKPMKELGFECDFVKLTTAILVYLANGLCGSGKTYISSDRIAEGILRGERYLIAGPTTQQSRQHAEAIRAALHRLKPRSMAAMLVSEINAETERRAVADAH